MILNLDWSLTKIVSQDNIVGLGQSTLSGRPTGRDNFEPAPKRVSLGEEHFLAKLDDLRNKLKHANEEISKLLGTVRDQELLLKERNSQLKRSCKKIVDLQRQVQALGKKQASFYKNSFL